VILTFECRVLGEGAFTTYINALGLTQPARVGLDITAIRMLSENTTTRLPQPVVLVIDVFYATQLFSTDVHRNGNQ
jgi:hypothetical protein